MSTEWNFHWNLSFETRPFKGGLLFEGGLLFVRSKITWPTLYKESWPEPKHKIENDLVNRERAEWRGSYKIPLAISQHPDRKKNQVNNKKNCNWSRQKNDRFRRIQFVAHEQIEWKKLVESNEFFCWWHWKITREKGVRFINSFG